MTLMLCILKGGHALVALYTDGAMPLHKVTCVPRGHALGIVGTNFLAQEALAHVCFFSDISTTRRRQGFGYVQREFG